jgi:hypothetical protein
MWQTLITGFVGGLIPDLLRLFALRDRGAPAYVAYWFFWVSFIGLGALGALACWLVQPTGAIEAFAIGYSAPSVLSRLGASQQATDRAENTSLRQWWRH